MTQPFIGEVRMFAGTFAPVGWLLCSGQTLSIGDYVNLYSLIGTTYGGDGQTTFVLPNLQGRTPVHAGVSRTTGTQYDIGQPGGVESVTLSAANVGVHTHSLLAAAVDGDMSAPTTGSGILSNSSTAAAADKIFAYAPYGSAVTMASGAGPPNHGSQPHDNMQPYVTVTFIIATDGVYPSHP